MNELRQKCGNILISVTMEPTENKRTAPLSLIHVRNINTTVNNSNPNTCCGNRNLIINTLPRCSNFTSTHAGYMKILAVMVLCFCVLGDVRLVTARSTLVDSSEEGIQTHILITSLENNFNNRHINSHSNESNSNSVSYATERALMVDASAVDGEGASTAWPGAAQSRGLPNGDRDTSSHQHPQPPGYSIWSSKEQEVIKQRILDGLGMKTVPPRHIYNVTAEEYQQAYAAYAHAVQREEARQQYLADVRYQNQYGYETEDSDDNDENDDDEDYDEERSTDEWRRRGNRGDEWDDEGGGGGDTSTLAEYKFFSTKSTTPSRGRGRRSLSNGDKIAHFHISVPLGNEDIFVVSAKASFFKKGNTEPNADDPKSVTLSMYRIDDIRKFRPKHRSFTETSGEAHLLKTLNISVSGDEWFDVNMTEAVRLWISEAKEDTGVLLRCPDCLSLGVIIRTGGTSHVPTLHVQTRFTASKRVKRSKDMRRATRAKRRKLGDCKDGEFKGRHSSRCCRRSMKVRFDDLPNFDFIVAPKDFDAFYCSGKCMPRQNPANEHALLQSLLNMQKDRNVPRPCCTPTDLKGLHILHFDDTGKLKTDLWSDVIVTECGCA